jgi:hypothetical protein
VYEYSGPKYVTDQFLDKESKKIPIINENLLNNMKASLNQKKMVWYSLQNTVIFL